MYYNAVLFQITIIITHSLYVLTLTNRLHSENSGSRDKDGPKLSFTFVNLHITYNLFTTSSKKPVDTMYYQTALTF